MFWLLVLQSTHVERFSFSHRRIFFFQNRNFIYIHELLKWFKNKLNHFMKSYTKVIISRLFSEPMIWVTSEKGMVFQEVFQVTLSLYLFSKSFLYIKRIWKTDKFIGQTSPGLLSQTLSSTPPLVDVNSHVFWQSSVVFSFQCVCYSAKHLTTTGAKYQCQNKTV